MLEHVTLTADDLFIDLGSGKSLSYFCIVGKLWSNFNIVDMKKGALLLYV